MTHLVGNGGHGEVRLYDSGPITTPVWLTGLWVALFIIRPWEELFPELAEIRIERLFALTVLAVVLGSGLFRFRGCTQTYAVLVYLAALAVSMLFAYDSSISWIEFYKYMTLVVFYFVLMSVIRSPYQLEFIIVCYIATMAIYLGKSQWEYWIHGRHGYAMGVSRMFGIETTFGHPNSVASSTVASLPFLQFLWWHRHEVSRVWPAYLHTRFSLFLIGYLVLAVSSIALTNSRSGAVQFALFAILFGKLRPQSPKRFKSFVAAIVVLVVVWISLPEQTKGRLTTLWDPEAGPANAKESADARGESFWAGVTMFSQYPLTGVGIGNSAAYRGKFIDGVHLAPHSLYGELLGDTGLIGTAAFIFLIAALLFNVRSTRAIARTCLSSATARLSNLATTCGYVVVLLLVSGLAGAGMVRFNWLWLAAFAALAREFSESAATEECRASDLADGVRL